MKQVIAKSWEHVSFFGEVTFYNVPVWVPDEFPSSKKPIEINSEIEPEVSVAGDVIHRMEREVAKLWIGKFVGETPRDMASLTPEEIHNILLVLGIKKTEFADLLKVSKGSITRYIKGSLKPTAPVCLLMIWLLGIDLVKPGQVKKLSAEKQPFLPGVNLQMRLMHQPQFNLQAA